MSLTERDESIRHLRNTEGLTYRTLGAMFHITRQRAHQICRAGRPSEGPKRGRHLRSLEHEEAYQAWLKRIKRGAYPLPKNP